MRSFKPAGSEYDAFASLLRHVRAGSGISQVELAACMAWDQSAISKVERGVRRLDLLELRHWLAALGFPLAEFVTELDRRLDAPHALRRNTGAATGKTPSKRRQAAR